MFFEEPKSVFSMSLFLSEIITGAIKTSERPGDKSHNIIVVEPHLHRTCYVSFVCFFQVLNKSCP